MAKLLRRVKFMKFFAINYCRLQDYLYLCIVFFMVLDY